LTIDTHTNLYFAFLIGFYHSVNEIIEKSGDFDLLDWLLEQRITRYALQSSVSFFCFHFCGLALLMCTCLCQLLAGSDLLYDV